MDIQLARTFLEVIASGNFQIAAGRLFVTQSAVSLRIKKLEDELGQIVFTRSKAGVALTPAGEQFERYARSLLQVWESARYQIAVPEAFEETLVVGAQNSLWPNLGLRWLRLLERHLDKTSLRAEIGQPDRLIRMLQEGTLDIAVLYTPQVRPGLVVETLFEDSLVLVSPDPDYPADLDERYVMIDWTPEFVVAHKTRFPDFRSSRTTLALGTIGLDYVIQHKRAGYFPVRVVAEAVEAGDLHIVADAPVFPFPTYIVWQVEREGETLEAAIALLRRVADKVDEDQDEVLEEAGADEVDEALTTSLSTGSSTPSGGTSMSRRRGT